MEHDDWQLNYAILTLLQNGVVGEGPAELRIGSLKYNYM